MTRAAMHGTHLNGKEPRALYGISRHDSVTQQSLPSFASVVNTCSGCHMEFRSTEERNRHEEICVSPRPRTAESEISGQAWQPHAVNQTAFYRLDNLSGHFPGQRYNNSVSSLSSIPTGTVELHSPRDECMTPISFCSASVAVGRSDSDPSPDPNDLYMEDAGSDQFECPMCNVANCKHANKDAKSERKKAKEQASRQGLAEIIQDIEDVLFCYLKKWQPGYVQTSGNRNSAGLVCHKKDLLVAAAYGLLKYLHNGVTEAIKQGREDEWIETEGKAFHDIIAKQREPRRGRDDIFKGFWLESPNAQACRAKGKMCAVHGGHMEQTECRKQRRHQKSTAARLRHLDVLQNRRRRS